MKMTDELAIDGEMMMEDLAESPSWLEWGDRVLELMQPAMPWNVAEKWTFVAVACHGLVRYGDHRAPMQI